MRLYVKKENTLRTHNIEPTKLKHILIEPANFHTYCLSIHTNAHIAWMYAPLAHLQTSKTASLVLHSRRVDFIV